MRELAAALNISVSTVSWALRNHKRVAASTRLRVQLFAKERGYRLNPSLTSLMSRVRSAQRAHYQETIGWIGYWDPTCPPPHEPAGEYQRSLWAGAVERTRQIGYALASFSLAEQRMTGQRLGDILVARGIRGLLIPPLPSSCGRIRIAWENFSAVALSHTLAWPPLHRVVPDHHSNMQLVLRTLHRRGYRRPALLLPEKFDERSQNRFRSAFLFHQQKLARADRVPVLVCGLADYEPDCTKWLAKFAPDVVITVGHYRGIGRLGGDCRVGVPKPALVLLGHGDPDEGFTALDENPGRIGATAVDQLVAQMSRNERGISEDPIGILIKGAWVEGRTLPYKNDRDERARTTGRTAR
jgi:LacI family transcriptional regulator